MSEPIILVEGVGKKYRLHHESKERYMTLRDMMTRKAKAIFNSTFITRKTRQAAPGDEEFWALKDLNFEINHGEVVGIIGPNGAGKSTLLKILSRITEPTTGRIMLNGRVASLLEVGTGFHPELTGRENIFLNGAILGMTKAEIKSKFDEIVAFAEVERFLDTPVKRYSSGMYVRLAFAVAAHLEPEILVVDEVLAVGDMEFQKKCLGKMEDVSKGGRTILFVSHNMDAIIRLCPRSIMLEAGQLVGFDATREIVGRYYASALASQTTKVTFKHKPDASMRGNLVLLEAEWRGSADLPPWTTPFGGGISFSIHFECKTAVQNVELGVALYAPSGTEIASSTSLASAPNIHLDLGRHTIVVTIHSLKLVPNNYFFGIGLKSDGSMEDFAPKAFAVDVVSSESSSLTKTDAFAGYIVPDITYALE